MSFWNRLTHPTPGSEESFQPGRQLSDDLAYIASKHGIDAHAANYDLPHEQMGDIAMLVDWVHGLAEEIRKDDRQAIL